MHTRADGRVLIAALECPGRHGAYPGEREVTRTFLVDIDARGRLGDDDAVAVAALARAAVAGPSRALLERVAADVAEAVLAGIDRIDDVSVRVTKPDPPGLDAASEAVALTRSRHAAHGSSAPSAGPAPRRARG